MPWSHLPYTLTHKGSTKVVLSAAFTSYWSVNITVGPVNGRRVDLINYARQAFLGRRTLPLTFIWFHFNVWEVWSITLWCPRVEEFSLTVVFRTGYHFSRFWAVWNNYCIFRMCKLKGYLNHSRICWEQCYLLLHLFIMKDKCWLGVCKPNY